MTDPTLTTAADAQHGLDYAGLEAALCATGDHLNAVAAHYGDHPLTGRQIGALLTALALGIRAYQQNADPVAARWNKVVTRDESGTAWVLCTTDPGQSVAIRLDEEHAEALAGGLLDTPDGEEVTTPGSPIARVRALHAPETHYAYAHRYGWSATCDHCDAAVKDASGALTTHHFTDQYGELRCRVRPRHTCGHCVIQEEEALWPCATIAALDEGANDGESADEVEAAATWPARAVRQLDADVHP